MIERELTGLEQCLYKFLDNVDTLIEGDCNDKRWAAIKSRMKRCKDECKTLFGVVCNGYSLHIELPFDVDKYMRERSAGVKIKDMNGLERWGDNGR